jgi:hypothetical protein
MNNLFFYVYQYNREESSADGLKGTPYYIGKGRDRRAWVSDRCIPKPKNKENIVFVAQNLSEENAFQLERLLILKYGRIDLNTGCLRNTTDGGEGISGHHHSEASRKKMSENKTLKSRLAQAERCRNKVWTKSEREKASKSHSGVKLSASCRSNMSKAGKGKKQTADWVLSRVKSKKSTMTRHPEIALRMSTWQKGKPKSEKAKENMRLAWARKRLSQQESSPLVD